VVSWDAIPKHTEPAKGLVQWAPGLHYDPALWMRVARLREEEHAAIASRCRHLGFITTEGTIWPPLLTVARNTAAKQIKAQTS
jgi:hypothetical protein